MIGFAPAAALAVGLYRVVERWIVWGVARVAAGTVRLVSVGLGELQTGLVRLYATVLVMGAAVLAAFFIGKAHL